MVFLFNKKNPTKFICGIRQASYWLGCLSEKPKAKNPKAKKIYPNGWKALKLLNKLTGIQIINGRYPPGIITNPNLEIFCEPKVLFACDPWPDKNAVQDAMKAGIPIIGLCDTNNESNNLDLVIPANNKGKKSVGLIVYLIAREYMRKKNMLRGDEELKEPIEDFVEE